MSENLVSSTRVAELLNVSSRRVRQLVDEGVLTFEEKKNNAYKFNEVTAVHQYITYWMNKASGKSAEDGSAEARKAAAEADFKRSKANIEAFKEAEIEGKMHRSDDVKNVLTDLVFTIRSMIISIPGRVSVDCANAGSASEVSAIIQEEVHKILNELTNYQYDPEVFAQRVAEREKLSILLEEKDE
jgi:phage terminase Nu1 subunit (DNA packaging protein)